MHLQIGLGIKGRIAALIEIMNLGLPGQTPDSSITPNRVNLKESKMSFFLGFAMGGATVYFWPLIKTKVLAWYDALVAKI